MNVQRSDASRSLTVEQLATLTGESVRATVAQVARWHARQFDQSVPRVRRAQVDGTMRWQYWVDRDTYEAFVLGQLRPHALPVCASEAARLLGCTCERIPLCGKIGYVVPEDCPVHRSIAQAC